MKVAYISGPYRAKTINGIHDNIERARQYAIRYWRKGYAVVCPHMNTALIDGAIPDSKILRGDIEMLKRCDVIVMIPGWKKSEGARAELKVAEERHIGIIFEEALDGY